MAEALPITHDQVTAVFADGISGVNGAIDAAAGNVRDLVNRLVEERDSLIEKVEELEAQREALEAVKHWMLAVLVHGKPVTDPRKILRIVERALEP